jgi:hypothetical protein
MNFVSGFGAAGILLTLQPPAGIFSNKISRGQSTVMWFRSRKSLSHGHGNSFFSSTFAQRKMEIDNEPSAEELRKQVRHYPPSHQSVVDTSRAEGQTGETWMRRT